MTRRGRSLFLWPAGTLLIIDQISKLMMTAWLQPRNRVVVIPGLFDLTYVRNTGAVFGLFRELGDPWRSLLLSLVPLAAIIFVLVVAARTPDEQGLSLFGLGLVLAGAIGNLADRIRLGSVVDFFDFHLAGHHWPAFNVADASICTGVGLLILQMFRHSDRSHDRESSAAPSDPSGAGKEA